MRDWMRFGGDTHLVLLLVLTLVVSNVAALSGQEPDLIAGTFEAVDGIAWVTTGGSRYPASPVGAIMAGDTITVETGQVTVFDLRSQKRYALGAPSVFPMPLSQELPKLGLSEKWDIFWRTVRRPRSCTAGVRSAGGIPDCWPNGEIFAITSTILFDWGLPKDFVGTPVWRSRRQGRQIVFFSEDGDTNIFSLTEQDTLGVKRCPPDLLKVPGIMNWYLVDDQGTGICGGSFTILSRAATETARKHYLELASPDFPDSLQTVGASLLAAADRKFIW